MATRRIIRGATVVPLEGRRVLRKTDILIEDGTIAALGGVDTDGAMITDVQGVVMPGLVQAHLHPDQALLDRHFVPDTDPALFQKVQLPAWVAELDAGALRLQAEAAFARGLQTGTVAFASAGGGRAALDAAIALGVRMSLCVDVTQVIELEKELEAVDREIQARDAGGLVRVALWAGDAERTPMRRLEAAARIAVARSLPLYVHLGSMPKDGGGMRRLERAGAIHRRLVVCHATGRGLENPRWVKALAEAKATVVLTPSLDLLIGAPPPPLDELLFSQVNLALGSDTNATRLGFDLFKELRILHRLLIGRVHQPASAALEIATKGGLHALGLPFGIAVGQPADLILLDVEAEPTDDHELVARRIIVQGEAAVLRTSWIQGEVAFSDGRIRRRDPPSEDAEEALRARAGFAVEQKLARRGLGALIGDVLARRGRLQNGWHAGRLPFLPEKPTD